MNEPMNERRNIRAVGTSAAQPDDDRIIAFPAESTFVGQWTVNTPVPEGQPMPAESSIVVKHVEWPIPELLKDSKYGKDFEGGILVQGPFFATPSPQGSLHILGGSA